MWKRKPGLQEMQDREFAKIANSDMQKAKAKSIDSQKENPVGISRIEFTKEEAQVVEILLSDLKFAYRYIGQVDYFVFLCICAEAMSEKEAEKSYYTKYRGSENIYPFKSAYKNMARKIKQYAFYYFHPENAVAAGLDKYELEVFRHTIINREVLNTLVAKSNLKFGNPGILGSINESAKYKLDKYYSSHKL